MHALFNDGVKTTTKGCQTDGDCHCKKMSADAVSFIESQSHSQDAYVNYMVFHNEYLSHGVSDKNFEPISSILLKKARLNGAIPHMIEHAFRSEVAAHNIVIKNQQIEIGGENGT